MQLPHRKPPKFTQYATDPLITRAKFGELQKRLARLLADRPRVADEVHRLAQNGDFSENAEYQMAKGRLRGMNDEIDRLQFQLDRAEIIDARDADRVSIGHMVTVLVSAKEVAYRILGSTETDPARGVISYTSPIGAALLGKKVGDEIAIEIAGRKILYKILAIT